MLPRQLVLVIEDEFAIRGFMAECLRGEGYEVAEWGRGTGAPECARELRPDLILLNLGLPGQSGQAVLQQLRADPATRAIPVVIVSATPDRAGATVALAQAVLPKPFKLTSLVDLVERFVHQDRGDLAVGAP